jgi:hypothetical protein
MMRWLAVVVALAFAPAAHASTPKFHLLSVGDGPAVTDGQRLVAFPHYAPSIMVYDFGVQFPYGHLVRAPTCAYPGATHTPDAGLAALGGGRIAWKCESFPTRFLLQDFASGAVTTVDDRELGESEAATPIGLGQRWLNAIRWGYHWTAVSYYDLLTGAWREELTSPRVYPNLDSPGLAETMCRPLRRIHAPEDDYEVVPMYVPFFYQRPFGVGVRDLGYRQGRGELYRIELQRCGSQKTTVVGRCRGYCADVELSGGLITWSDGRALRAYAARSGRRYSWPYARFGPLAASVTITHTPQRLIASVEPPRGGRDWQIWSARVPSEK